jgi:hypothetical protein
MAMVGDSFSKAWDVFREDMGAWVATTFVWSIAASVAGSVIPVAGGLVLLPNMIREASDAVEQGRSPEIANVFNFDHIGNDFISMLLYAGSQFAGMMLCCIGWPFAWIGFWYSAELAADDRIKPVDTLKVSWWWAKDNIGDTLAIALLGMLLNTIGATVGLGIGMIVTLPITVLAWVIYWHQVKDSVYAMAQSRGIAVAPPTRQPAQLIAESPVDAPFSQSVHDSADQATDGFVAPPGAGDHQD